MSKQEWQIFFFFFKPAWWSWSGVQKRGQKFWDSGMRCRANWERGRPEMIIPRPWLNWGLIWKEEKRGSGQLLASPFQPTDTVHRQRMLWWLKISHIVVNWIKFSILTPNSTFQLPSPHMNLITELGFHALFFLVKNIHHKILALGKNPCGTFLSLVPM